MKKKIPMMSFPASSNSNEKKKRIKLKSLPKNKVTNLIEHIHTINFKTETLVMIKAPFNLTF